MYNRSPLKQFTLLEKIMMWINATVHRCAEFLAIDRRGRIFNININLLSPPMVIKPALAHALLLW
jgi:hypothetical protein